MPLNFEAFGVRRVEIAVLMWPGFSHGFHQGELSELYGKLNTDDLFESADLRANLGAEFESEHWNYDISTTRIRIRSESFQSREELERRVMHLLEETKTFFDPRLRYLFTDTVKVRGVVPEDRGKDVGEVLRSKLLPRRLTQNQGGQRVIDRLPGVHGGAGITLVGDTDSYHWHADVGPTHVKSTVLGLTAELYFEAPVEAPTEEMIRTNLNEAYDFLKEHVLGFAQTSLT